VIGTSPEDVTYWPGMNRGEPLASGATAGASGGPVSAVATTGSAPSSPTAFDNGCQVRPFHHHRPSALIKRMGLSLYGRQRLRSTLGWA
jgi:hypothetical protein